MQPPLSHSAEDASKRRERLAVFFLFFIFASKEEWAMTPRAFLSMGRAKNVVILLLTGFSRDFCSSLRRMAAHPKGSDTPSSSAPRLPFNADATTRSAFSEKYLICLLFLPAGRVPSFQNVFCGCYKSYTIALFYRWFLLNTGAPQGACWSQSRLSWAVKAQLDPGSQGHVNRQWQPLTPCINILVPINVICYHNWLKNQTCWKFDLRIDFRAQRSGCRNMNILVSIHTSAWA